MRKMMTLLAVTTMATIALVGCGKQSPSENAASANKSATIYNGVSVDFEDGNMGFVAEASPLKGGDPVVLTIEDLNGSKALKTTNAYGKESLFVGFDVEALLGEKAKDVRYIQLSIGVTDDEFHAISGSMYAYVGKENDERILGNYSVYLDTDNPKTVVFELKDSFVPGANNYFIISKEENASDIPSDITIDNIGFFDENGNVIEADTTKTASKTSPLNSEPIDKTRLANGKECDLGGEYGGDWGQTGIIPAEFFENAEGDINVTVSIGIESGKEYYLMAPIPANNWNKKLKEEDLVDLKVADSGVIYHLQQDGFIKLDDWSANAVSFTITKEAAERYATGGGMTFQTMGIRANKAIVSTDTCVAVMNGTYGGDWGQTSVITPLLFENVDGTVTVTVDVYFEPGREYYLMAPIPANDWGHKFKEDSFVDLKVGESNGQYHLQEDGFIAFDDWETDTVSFTLTKEAAEVLANGDGLTFQIYGITAASAAITKNDGGAEGNE